MKNKLGLSYRKFRPLPGGKKSIEQLVELQKNFLENDLNPLLDKANRAVVEVFYVDAAHPVMGFHSGQVWSKDPIYVRTSSGRTRMNILGAINAVSHELFSLTTTDYIKAVTVVELLKFLREELPGKRIHLILDNARYQRCKLVEKKAKKYNIHLLFLPPYSPNLNLIERFWKLLKKQVLSGQWYKTKKEFMEAIYNFIDQVNQGDFDKQIHAIMKPKFQTLKTN